MLKEILAVAIVSVVISFPGALAKTSDPNLVGPVEEEPARIETFDDLATSLGFTDYLTTARSKEDTRMPHSYALAAQEYMDQWHWKTKDNFGRGLRPWAYSYVHCDALLPQFKGQYVNRILIGTNCVVLDDRRLWYRPNIIIKKPKG